MEKEQKDTIITRKELRRQKLMEYLVTKGKLKVLNPAPCIRDNCQVKKPVSSALQVIKSKENKAPASSLRTDAKKGQTLGPLSTQENPARKVFAVSNKLSIKGGIVMGQHSRSSITTDQAQSKRYQNPELTRTNTVSSKSNLSTITLLKTKPNTEMQPSGKMSSTAKPSAENNSSSRLGTKSNIVWSCPTTTFTGRVSLAPIVKTKTGLMPAMIQPRHTKTVLPRTSATIVASSTTSSVAKKVGSSISSSVPVSKGSWKAQKKTFTTPGLNQPVKEKTSLAWTQRAGITAQDPHKCNSKQPLGKPSHSACRVPRSNGLTSRFTTSMCASASVNSTHTSAGMPKGISRKQRSEIRGEKREPICKATSQTSSGSACDGSARVVSEVPRGVTDAKGEKNSIFKEKESKMGHRSIKACPRKMSEKRSSAPVMSQTVPRPARTISRARRTTDMKMPKLPVVVSQTVGNKLTAAQEERMRKLQEWRESKGISYKRPPMPVKPQVLPTMAMAQPFWAAMKVEDEAHTFICAVDKSLADCIKLLGESCPPDQVKKVLSRLPAVSQKFAKYWICKARLMEQEGNLDVLPLFEEAVRVVLEPVDELRSVVFEILKKKDELQASEEDKDSCPSNVESTPEGSNDPMTTPPKPVRALICGETGDSSVVKYKITATPRGPLSAHKQMAPARVNGQEVRFFTPVRRSVRIERASLQYPASLQEHDLCVTSYNDVMAAEDKNINEEIIGGESSPSADDTLMYVYRPNEALTDKVMVQFLCEEI